MVRIGEHFVKLQNWKFSWTSYGLFILKPWVYLLPSFLSNYIKVISRLFLHQKFFKRHFEYKWYMWESLLFFFLLWYKLPRLADNMEISQKKIYWLIVHFFPESRNLRLHSSSGEITKRNKNKTKHWSYFHNLGAHLRHGAALMAPHFKPSLLCWRQNKGHPRRESSWLNCKSDCPVCLRKGINI